MPGIYPEQSAPVTLRRQADVAENARTKFYARFLSYREENIVREKWLQSAKLELEGEKDQARQLVDEVFDIMLAKIDNANGIDKAKITDYLGSADIIDLYDALTDITNLSRDEKKESGSPSSEVTDSSVSTANEEPPNPSPEKKADQAPEQDTDATTNPAKTAPPASPA